LRFVSIISVQPLLLIAVDRDSNIATPFHSSGMYRAMADSLGRFEIAICPVEK